MSFPRYPDYKDSGVEWLGEVPGHWEVVPFKHQIERNDGGVWGDDPDGIDDTIVLRSTEQTVDGHWKLDDPAARKLSESEIRGSLLAENDLLLTKSSGSSLHIGKTTLVTAEIAEMRCCYSNFMQRIRMKPTFVPKLAWHVMNNDLARLQFDLLSNSSTGLANLNATMVGQIVVPVPPLPEQTQIAAFLDRETAKIDELVAEQRRLMALLKEKRQAVISHAVTRGLNPDAPMKPSGIEWLGDVPAHWEVRPLKHLARLQTGMTPATDEWDNYAEDDGFQWIRPEDLDETGTPTKSSKFLTDKGWSQTRQIKAGSSLICCIGTIGKVGITTDVVSTNQQITSAEPRQHGRYLFYAICAGRSELELASTGNVLRILNTERLGNIQFAKPPIPEQTQIAAYLERESAKFDTLITEAQRAIDLLQERRTALISAAVTGQIDVRGAVQ